MRLNGSPSTKTNWSLPKSGIWGFTQPPTYRKWPSRDGWMEEANPDILMKGHERKRTESQG